MIEWDAEVLASMMGAGVFGEDQQPLYQPQSGGFPFVVDGVFDDAYVGLTTQGDEPAYATFRPVLGVRLSQFPCGFKPEIGDYVTIPRKNTTYQVMNVMADGHGWAKLELMTTGSP